jgi:type II secretory pathway component PulL
MFIAEYFIVFPEGDTQEIHGRLTLNQLVDLNGNALELPLPTNRMIVFRVVKIKTNEYKGGTETFHFLEQVSARELIEYVEE